MTTTTYCYSGNSSEGSNRRTVKQGSDVRKVERMLIRLGVAGVFFILLFSGLTLMKGKASGEHPAAPAEGERMIIVGAGETLWEIAGGIRDEDEDLRHVVYELKQRNQLEKGVLRAGQTLIIPADK